MKIFVQIIFISKYHFQMIVYGGGNV